MADYTLHGNNEPCPACALQRENIMDHMNEFGAITDHRHVHVPCQMCQGNGLLALSDSEIARRSAEAARRDYWPAREAAWAAQMGNVVVMKRRKAGK